MNRIRLFSLFSIIALMSGVATFADEEHHAPAEEAPVGADVVSADTMAIYGADDVVGSRGVALDKVLANIDMFDGVMMTVSGTIDEVCVMKGCWMTMKSDDPAAPSVRVRFKDYSFFVPRNAGDHKVTMVGKLSRTELPEEVARHYAEDGGASPEEIAKIVGPQPVIEIVATSVAISDPGTLDAPFGAEEKVENDHEAPTSRPTSRPTAG